MVEEFIFYSKGEVLKNLKKDNLIVYVILNMIKRYKEHEIGATGAYLAYFFILSIFPFFIFLNALISRISFSPESIFITFSNVLPKEIMDILKNYLNYIKQGSSDSIFSFGIITTIFTSSKAFGAILLALNKSYKNEKRKSGIIEKLSSIFGTIFLGFSILFSFVILSIGNDFWVFLSNYFKLPMFFLKSWDFFKWIIIFLSLLASLGLLHFIIPNERVRFKQIIPGTIFSIVTWTLMSFGFSFYVKHFSSYSVIYGSLGAIIILLLWLYLTGVLIVLGAELNHILIERKQEKLN